jgi:hypothetical protein
MTVADGREWWVTNHLDRGGGQMLVNMMGVDEADGVVDLESRRPEPAVDPKARDTLTTLVGALLASYVTPAPPATTTDRGEPAGSVLGSIPAPREREVRSDAA